MPQWIWCTCSFLWFCFFFFSSFCFSFNGLYSTKWRKNDWVTQPLNFPGSAQFSLPFLSIILMQSNLCLNKVWQTELSKLLKIRQIVSSFTWGGIIFFFPSQVEFDHVREKEKKKKKKSDPGKHYPVLYSSVATYECDQTTHVRQLYGKAGR